MVSLPIQADFRPTASWPNLRLRAELLRKVRSFFHCRRFLEVETPVLSADTVVDRHLDPFGFEVTDVSGYGDEQRLWLQTSPEFGMKRLLASGAKAIYQIARVFRQEERGTLHNPEFTMVEWYRVGDTVAEGMRLLSDLSETLSAHGPAERLTYREAFERYVALDPHLPDATASMAAARARGVRAPDSLEAEDRDGWLDLLLAECIQPKLGHDRPVILHDYPASQAALARIRPGPPAVAERFELYVCGMELANGYHELLDAEVLRRRNVENNALRRACGREPLPEESRLMEAMQSGLPPSVGVAMGFDRLVMLAAGAGRIDDVIAFPAERA